MEALRREVYERDGGQCQWPGCGKVLPYEGHDLFRAHLAHIVPRSRGGSDTEENTRILCPAHHIGVEHAYGKTGIKPCKKKEGVTLPERQQHGSD
jgi:5-methylcytosine-specific restriction endonuclease McrA